MAAGGEKKLGLREYQKTAAKYAVNRKYAYLGMEVGLGKTLVSLAVIKHLKLNTLVVGPKAVVEMVWPEEIAKWTPEFSHSVCTGTLAHRQQAIAADVDINLVSYNWLAWVIDNFQWRWDLVIFDEASFMKSDSQRTKAFLKIRDKAYRIIMLSGTPVGNSIQNLFFQYKCLDGGATLGTTVGGFREKYMVNRGFNFPNWQPRADKMAELKSRIKSKMLVMRAKDYLPQLPKVIIQPVYFDLSVTGRTQYVEMLKKSVLLEKDFVVAAVNSGVKASKLRQICSGFVYDKTGEGHFLTLDKLNAYKSLCQEIGEDEQILTFYQFKEEEKIIDGEPLNQKNVHEWNYGRLKRMKAHPRSSGHGLNLQKSSAKHIIFFSMPWSSEEFIQTIGRLKRSGNKSEVIIVHQMISRGTVEVKIARGLKEKCELEEELLQ